MSTYFAGSGTSFGAARAGSTSPKRFSAPEGTAPSASPRRQEPVSTPGLNGWLKSQTARSLAGRWVLLSDDFDVLDHATSPGELLERHPHDRSPTVVFVEPQGVDLAV
jgi:hypothetical protein